MSPDGVEKLKFRFGKLYNPKDGDCAITIPTAYTGKFLETCILYLSCTVHTPIIVRYMCMYRTNLKATTFAVQIVFEH